MYTVTVVPAKPGASVKLEHRENGTQIDMAIHFWSLNIEKGMDAGFVAVVFDSKKGLIFVNKIRGYKVIGYSGGREVNG